MVERDETSSDAENPNASQGNSPIRRELRGVFVAAAWAFNGLLLVAKFWPHLPQRMAFFTAALFNLIIAFAVIAQVVIYRKQWAVMQSQITSAEKSSIWANRAYVVAKIRDTGPYDDRLQFRLKIQNTGNTPANDVVALYAFGLREKPPHKETPNGMVVYDMGFTETERLGLVAPNGSYQVITTMPPVPLDMPITSPEYKLWE